MRISACGMRCLLGALVFLLHALMQAEPSLARAVSDRHPHSSDGALSASLISAQHDVQRRYLPDTMVSGAQWNTRTTSANTVGANVCYVQGKTYRFGTTWQMKVNPRSMSFMGGVVPALMAFCKLHQVTTSVCVRYVSTCRALLKKTTSS